MMKPLQLVNQIKIGKMERLELPKVLQIPSQDVGISFPSCAYDFFSLQAFGAFPNTGISHTAFRRVMKTQSQDQHVPVTGALLLGLQDLHRHRHKKKTGHHLHGLHILFRLGYPPIYNYPEVDRIWDVQSYSIFD